MQIRREHDVACAWHVCHECAGASVGGWVWDMCVLRRGGHSSGGRSKQQHTDLNTLTIIMHLAMTTPATTTSPQCRTCFVYMWGYAPQGFGGGCM